jgi:uncharacterized protein YjbI with pentapeptide repeats
MDRERLTRGKVKLDAAKYAVDLSGKDFEDIFLESPQTLSHSFLNGASFKNSAFMGAPIDQTELAEAEILGCYFENVDFTGSSFIGATVTNTTFQNCNFTDGEWRQSRFSEVRFIGCDFNYTTVNLCIFDRCEFSGENARRLDNRSVNYNVFSQSNLDFLIEDEVVLASNFGLRGKEATRSLTNYGSRITLEEICLKSGSNDIVISELIDAIENEFTSPKVVRLKLLRLEFISNIIVAMAKASKISATSLIYIENFFSTLMKSAASETEALAVMRVLFNLRRAQLDIFEQDFTESTHAKSHCRGIGIIYERTYNRADADELANILSKIASGRSDTFVVTYFAVGSTSIQLIASHAVTVGATLMAINFALKQANVTLVQANKIGKNFANLIRPALKKSKRKTSRRKTDLLVQRIPTPQKEMTAVRQTVRRHGRRAVLLDDKSTVTVYYDSSR